MGENDASLFSRRFSLHIHIYFLGDNYLRKDKTLQIINQPAIMDDNMTLYDFKRWKVDALDEWQQGDL